MKVGVFSDVHGNLPALDAVLDELIYEHQVDEFVCCGDLVGGIGWSDECVDQVSKICDHVVFGNHDARVRSDFAFTPSHPVEHDEMTVVSEDLSERSTEYLNTLPQRIETEELIVAHSFPERVRDSDHSVHGFSAGDYGVRPRDVPKAGKYANGKYICLGHTHYPFEQSLDKFAGQSGHYVNPGSVGEPKGDDPEYAVIDTEEDSVSLCSVEYDTETVRDRLDELAEEYDLYELQERYSV